MFAVPSVPAVETGPAPLPPPPSAVEPPVTYISPPPPPPLVTFDPVIPDTTPSPP